MRGNSRHGFHYGSDSKAVACDESPKLGVLVQFNCSAKSKNHFSSSLHAMQNVYMELYSYGPDPHTTFTYNNVVDIHRGCYERLPKKEQTNWKE